MFTKKTENNVSSRNGENTSFDSAPVASTQRVLSPESCKQLLLKLREKDKKKLNKNSDRKTEAVSDASKLKQPRKVLSPQGCKRLLATLKEKELMKRGIENQKQESVLLLGQRKLTITNRSAKTESPSKETNSMIPKKVAVNSALSARKMSRCKTAFHTPYSLAKAKSNNSIPKIVIRSISNKDLNESLSLSTAEFIHLENKYLNDPTMASSASSITPTPSKSTDLLNNMYVNNEEIIKEIKSTFQHQCEMMQALQINQTRILSLITKLEQTNRNLNSVTFNSDILTETSNKIEDLRKVVLTKNTFAQSVQNDSQIVSDFKRQNALDMYNKQKSFF